MNWEHYEVWAVSDDGHESLIDTTGSLKAAKQLAKDSMSEDVIECVIYAETPDGELVELEVIKR